MRGEDEPEHAANAYAAELDEHFGADRRFSLVLLGMGDDGHTASLFPHSPALAHKLRWQRTYVKKLDSYRLTLTLATLNAAATVLFLVSGKGKARALNDVFGNKGARDGLLPAQLVKPSNGELIWLVL